MRKVAVLVVLAVAVWLGMRYVAHRGEVKATVVFRSAGALQPGDPVMESGRVVGRVTRVTPLDGQSAVAVRLGRPHRRAVVTDSLFGIDGRSLVVTNTFAIGKPIEDGAVLQAREDRVNRWLAKFGQAVQPLVAKMKRATDQKLDAVDADALRARIDAMEDELMRSHRAAEARELRRKFDRWLDEVRR
jgi:ABC-type transporter Mla subunit MlaD